MTATQLGEPAVQQFRAGRSRSLSRSRTRSAEPKNGRNSRTWALGRCTVELGGVLAGEKCQGQHRVTWGGGGRGQRAEHSWGGGHSGLVSALGKPLGIFRWRQTHGRLLFPVPSRGSEMARKLRGFEGEAWAAVPTPLPPSMQTLARGQPCPPPSQPGGLWPGGLLPGWGSLRGCKEQDSHSLRSHGRPAE